MNKGVTFVLGVAVGAIGALLLSPHSGQRNREILSDSVQHCTESGQEAIHRAAETVRDRAHEVSEQPKPTTDDIRQKINEARDRIAEQVTRNRSVQNVDSDVSDVAEEAATIAEGNSEAQATA